MPPKRHRQRPNATALIACVVVQSANSERLVDVRSCQMRTSTVCLLDFRLMPITVIRARMLNNTAHALNRELMWSSKTSPVPENYRGCLASPYISKLTFFRLNLCKQVSSFSNKTDNRHSLELAEQDPGASHSGANRLTMPRVKAHAGWNFQCDAFHRLWRKQMNH